MNDSHRLGPAEIVGVLRTDVERGLEEEEAGRRLAVLGPNVLPPGRKRSQLVRLLLQFHHPLIYILLGTAAVTAALQEWVDSGVILGVVVVNAIIGFIQEAKAERALESLKDMLAPVAVVLRDGRKASRPASELVPGDIVYLEPGDRVPADLRLVKVKNLHVDEAPLTGESFPVPKVTEPLPADTPVADRRNLAFSATLVNSGQGTGVVAATGAATEIGKIAGALESAEEVETPLIRRLAVFSKWLTVVILAVSALLFALGALKGNPPMEMFMAAVALVVSAIPEGLPAIMTITLAIGVKRMAARNAIIRRLPAVETLGSTTVICSDKTGTLTRNEMTVTAIEAIEGRVDVTGVGYAPTGSPVRPDGSTPRAMELPSLSELLAGGVLCSDATIRHEDGKWRITGDPTEAALVVLAEKAGVAAEGLRRRSPRVDVVPFDSESQLMATLNEAPGGEKMVYLKGAPEVVFPRCASEWGTRAALSTNTWESKAKALASEGLRVLALCAKPAPAAQHELHPDDLGGGFALLGLVGMMDPPREEAIEAVRKCRSAGIRVKMITGDHVETARAVARRLGIGGGEAVVGRDIDAQTDEAFERTVQEVDVFARVTPAHKLRLVRALQRHREVVAMTGDGVNDAPALKQADIGVAMGITGTEVSRQASDMVLADDNFASIARAVEEGRTVFDNLRKSLIFILPTNGGACLTLIAAIAAGVLLPVLPLHILWVNLVTTVALAVTLAFEPAEPAIMQRPPRRPDAPLVDGVLLWRIAFVSALMAAGTFGLFFHELRSGTSLDVARTVAVNAIVSFEVFYLFNTRFLQESVLNRAGLLGNRVALVGVLAVVALQAAFTYWPLMHKLLRSAPLEPMMWARIVAASVVLLLLVEAEKLVSRRLTR